ncbi:Abi family protein [Aliidiomarina maris]|uniref:Abi-like protein n=1 Tax=Aliidiomarina maris TaxID=531312 RepID=A0A327X405_9GAMM|nr:Abi family protein [Aliidiomarina maris]RAK01880.1 Abi-like protein [Aliidiomarina maris]
MSKRSDTKTAYAKPWLSYQEQLAQLKVRGLSVTDDEKALDNFKAGATFQNAVELYVFDKKLRIHLLNSFCAFLRGSFNLKTVSVKLHGRSHVPSQHFIRPARIS